jgi:prevent-host-death family protein
LKNSGQNDIVWSEFIIQARLFFFGVRVSMQSVGIYEAKSRFSALIELVEQGEEVRITRHGKEVVRMLPVRRRPVITDEQIARELGQIDALHATVRPAVEANPLDTLRPAGDAADALRRVGRSAV